MNSYFKTHEEIDQLFQLAYAELNKNGYDTAADLFKEAFRHDPYRLEANYKLAIYFATIKEINLFKGCFFRCWNIDVAYKEKIAGDVVVVNALGAATIADVIAAKDKRDLWIRKDFVSLDPPGDEVILKFKPEYKKEIAKFFHSLEYKIAKCFIIDQLDSATATLAEFNSEEDCDFDKIDYFRLSYEPDRVYMDESPEAVFAALPRLSPYIEDIRFLGTSEWYEDMEEVVIEQGKMHIYLHPVGMDYDEEMYDYFERIVDLYPEDRMLRRWLWGKYELEFRAEVNNERLDSAEEELNKILRLSEPGDPLVLFLKGKFLQRKGDVKTAIICFKEALAKNYHAHEIYQHLGELLLFHTDEYRESARLLSAALDIRMDVNVLIKRALACYKTGEIKKANIDIEFYISKMNPFNNTSLVSAGQLFSKAGFSSPANILFEAGLEKNRAHEKFLTENMEESASPLNGYFRRQLVEHTGYKLEAWIGLAINAVSPESGLKYGWKHWQIIL